MKLIFTRLLIFSCAFCAAQATSLEEHLAAGNEMLRAGRYQEAENTYWAALKAAEMSGPQRLKLVANLNSVALAYRFGGRHTEAEVLYRRVLALWDKNQLPPDRYKITILSSLSNLYWNQNKLSQALSLKRRALSIWESTIGQDDPAIATLMENIGVLLYSMHRYSEAEHVYRMALSIQVKALGRRHPETATTLNNLAAVLQAIGGRCGEVEDLYREAQSIRETTLGSQHPDVGKTLNNLAAFQAQQGKYEPAERLYQRAIETLESTDHPMVAVVLANLAQLYLTRSRYYDAEPLNLRALAMMENSLAPEDPQWVVCLLNQAIILRNTKRKAEAARFQVRAEAIKAKWGPSLSNQTIDVSVLQSARGHAPERRSATAAKP